MTKLPADLPENWTQGQTVSPNGTEVGLTEQHGYNYLMKQVNATQKEVNGIQDALPDVAQQTTVEEINQKIGTEGDADWTIVNKKDTIFKYIFWERLDSLPIPECCFHFIWC